ncbi:hypothetical protein GIB67_037417 [Kingdonia uniflora]|uniref:RNA helicase n=1 Tax=Kingdonia uniflora TaxID=39325 RepID=A0A7J7M8K4_9MAGN|nr:hypothetical protein GIB67_037417 [Kingdonia uniflora]
MADTATNTATIEKVPEPKRSWGDEAEEEESSTTVPELSIEGLKIEEEPITTLVDEPEDSNIEAVTGDTLYSTATTFEELNLSKELLLGLYVDMGFKRPSKIQAKTLPMILTPPYKDLIAQAHNGSGKTTCFVLGMLSRVDPNVKAPQALCICPTRELAIQNLEVLTKMAKHTGITATCAIPMDRDASSARQVVTDQVVIGTPGTTKGWVAKGKLSIREMKILVFDEADHMLAEDGFKDDSLRIIKNIRDPKNKNTHCQVLLFSATFNDTVKNFVSRVVSDSNQLFVKKEELTLEAVKQFKVRCPDEISKLSVVKDKIIGLGEKVGQTIIFVHSRKSADMLHSTLAKEGWVCTNIHGAIDKEFRDKIVKEFKEGLTKVLITTDLLSRGFDQSQVNLVVNYDLPVKHGSYGEPDYEVYMHRCGRAGRFGRKGAVFNLLLTERDSNVMDKIQNHFSQQVAEVPNWDSDEDFEAALKSARLLD